MKQASKKPLISVIIPVYNVEKYVGDCIESILHQDYENIEIVIVDDGSTDSSLRVCREFSEKFSNIKIIHQKNVGVSAARNVGVRESRGEYVAFVDPDDTVSTDFLSYLYSLNITNNTKIAVAPYIIVTEKKKINCSCGRKKDERLPQKEALRRMLLDDGFTVSNGSKLIKKELFDDVEYPEGRIFEDTATTYKMFLKCDFVSYGSKGGYFYYKRGGSILNSKYDPRQLDFIAFTDEMAKEILAKYPDLENAAESKKIDSRFSIYRRLVLSRNLDSDGIATKEKIEKYLLARRKKIIFGSFNKKIKAATILLAINEKVFKYFWLIYCKIKYKKAIEG